MTTRAALQPGTLLEDRYKIVSILRAGGMGALYCAHDTRLADSPCAVKEMLPQHDGTANSDYIRRRFLEEMKVLARLNHPDIPRVRDYFVEGGLNYIVMDLVEGSNLLDAMHDRGQPLPAPEVVRLGLSILSILEYLHSHNPPTVHRDIKPANILIERGSGRFKLVDFGLACDSSTGATVHTQVGTLGYCPLEQIQGKATPKSDLYALGATMHHLLTNEAPVPLQVKPLGKVRPDLPARLVEIVNRALAAKPEQRFPDALTFRTALEKIPELLAPTDNDPTGRIAPPSMRMEMEMEMVPEARPPHPDFYQAAPTQVQQSAWPWIIGLAVCVSMLFLGILVSRQNGSQQVASAPSPAAMREIPVAVVPPPPAPQESRGASTPGSSRAPVQAQPDFIPKEPAQRVVRTAPTPVPVARKAPTRVVSAPPSYPTYPTARVKERPTPPPDAPPLAIAPLPQQQNAPPPPQNQEPPPQPQQMPPQGQSGFDTDPSHYVATSPPTGAWPGHPNEQWPIGPDGQPLKAVRYKPTNEVWPSRHGQLPAHLEREGRPGGGPPGGGGGGNMQGPPGLTPGSRPPGY